MTREEYQAVLDAISDAETDVDNQYKKVGDASSTLCDINNTISQINNMSVVYNRGGDVIGYDYVYTSPDIPDPSIIGVDSNADNGWYATGGGGRSGGGGAGRERRNTSAYSGGVNTNSQSTDKLNGNGLVSGLISGAFGAVSALSKLGKSVINTAGDYIKDTVEAVSNTFSNLFVDKDGNDAIRVLYGVDSNGNINMYMDEDTIGAFAIGLKDEGFFDSGETTYTYPTGNVPALGNNVTCEINLTPIYDGLRITRNNDNWYYIFTNCNFDGKTVSLISIGGGVFAIPINDVRTSNYLTFSIQVYRANGQLYQTVNYQINDVTFRGADNVVYTINRTGFINQLSHSDINFFSPSIPWSFLSIDGVGDAEVNHFAYEMSQATQHTVDPIPGTSTQTGATVPVDAITGADPHVVAQNLATQYSNVMGPPIQVVVMDDSCNEKTINYYAVPMPYSPTNLIVEVPVTGNTQVDISFNPTTQLPDIDMDNFMTQVINQLHGTGAGEGVVNTEPDPVTGEEMEAPLPTEPPATGTGNTPEWLPDDVVGNTVLWHVYNTTPAQLNQFGYWLWVSGDIVTQFKRIVSDPMDAILGLHKVYVTPNRGSPTTIVCGNLDSEVSAFPVTNQYSEINCGDVWITEYFGNVYDYSPYTDISVYLPFIGIVPVSVDDVMRGKMSIHYTVDVYTGACIAEISINRDGVGGILYQFNGNCAVEYPITSMSYNNAIMACIGITSGAISAIPQMASGNVIGAGASMAGSLLHSTMQQRETVQRSGSFSGNAGAMGAKKPYVIITRPQPEIAENYEDYEGYGANATVEIGNCSGYIKCRTVDLEISGAYKSELDEIEALLKGGVYV